MISSRSLALDSVTHNKISLSSSLICKNYKITKEIDQEITLVGIPYKDSTVYIP